MIVCRVFFAIGGIVGGVAKSLFLLIPVCDISLLFAFIYFHTCLLKSS